MSYCVPEYGVSLIVSLNANCLIIVSLIRIASYYCDPEHGVSLFVSLNTVVSYCVPKYGLSIIIVSLNTERVLLTCP